MTKHRYSTVANIFGSCADRYVLDGYTPKKTFDEMLDSFKEAPAYTGVELIGGWHLNDGNAEEIVRKVADRGLEVSMLIPELWSQGKWGWGTFASRDPKIRRQAIDTVKKSMELAARINCNNVSPWFGHDGYDYVFGADFIRAWDLIVEGLAECAEYNPDVKIAVEYKPREPRTHCFVSNLAKVLMLCQEVNKPNVGVNLDVGHALQGYENMAECVAMCKRFGDRLFHLHLNDNYRSWDDDMMPCSVHTLEWIELLYWLERTGYNGWYSLDVFPYRDNGVEIANESIGWFEAIFGLIEKVGMDRIENLITDGDPIKTSGVIRKAMFGI